MNSALKYGTSVRRIVVTSSTVAVNTFPSSPEVYDETNWNETATANVEKLGRDANNMEKYCASKTLAEKGIETPLDHGKGAQVISAAWRLYEDNKAKGTWLFSLLHVRVLLSRRPMRSLMLPVQIFGPVLREIESADQLNTPMAHRHDLVLKGSPDESESLANDGLAWVDVRDLALADWRRWGLVESESSYPPDCTRIKTGVIHFSLLNEIGI